MYSYIFKSFQKFLNYSVHTVHLVCNSLGMTKESIRYSEWESHL